MVGAIRGRNPKNPSDRTIGAPTEQRLELNRKGTSNTITTVQKDNVGVMFGESSKVSIVDLLRVLQPTEKAQTYRIRRLIPRECLRLMAFPETFKIAVSDTQVFKQAGNSIVVDVLHLILKNLIK